MTAQERNLLRELIDLARRQRIRSKPGCVSCGTPYDEHNTGCWHCNERHKKRRQRKTTPGIPRGWCAGCGKRYYEETPDCLQCAERHRGRERRRKAVA